MTNKQMEEILQNWDNMAPWIRAWTMELIAEGQKEIV